MLYVWRKVRDSPASYHSQQGSKTVASSFETCLMSSGKCLTRLRDIDDMATSKSDKSKQHVWKTILFGVLWTINMVGKR